MKEILILIVFALSSVTLNAQDITGDWQGTLNTGTTRLRLILHITQDKNGNLKATMDSIDQGARGIPVSSISLKNSRLKFEVDAIQGSYVGKLSANVSKISGSWLQREFYDLDFKRANASVPSQPKPAPPSDIDGVWMGTITAGGSKLRIVFHITNTADGLTATMDSPDQGVKGIPVTAVTRNGPSLKIEMKQTGGAFEGKISADLATIDGTWVQSGGTWPLVLQRVKDVAELEPRRPQNPVKPYPYREEEVTYNNKAQNVTLAATLIIPPGKGPFPAVLLISGSGPHDRDETLFGHKPFLVLSDYLTRKGVVVLRADDRGVGKSTGNRANATTADFATDAEAGVAYLKTCSEVDVHKIGLIGHSEGAVIAPMVAARNPDVAFIVMMAGSGVPGDQLLVEQKLLLSEASGMNHELAEKDAAWERELLALIEQEKDGAALGKKLREKLTGKVPGAQVEGTIKGLTSPWFRYFISYDPAIALRNVKCPVLAINGEKDLQVSPKQNLPAIKKALEEGGNQHSEVDQLSGLNHLFQTAKTGAVTEYAEIEETMSPIALEKIAGWVLKQ
jgi:pimeloyl-ACP methyl ester carboxylesterase